MDLDRDLENKLKTGLEALTTQTRYAQDYKPTSNEIQQHLDLFDMEWQDRINDAELSELRGCRTGIEEASNEFFTRLRMGQYMHHSAALPPMTPEQQVAFWDSNRNGSIQEFSEKSQKEISDIAFVAARQKIQDRYANLRDGLIEAVNEISQGKSPSLTFLLDVQIEKKSDVMSRQAEFDKLVQSHQNEQER